MKLYDLLQVMIVGGALLFSVLYALGRIAPDMRKRCSGWLMQAGRPRWLRYVGAKLAGPAGCGDGCHTCGSCGPTSRVEDNDDQESGRDRLRKIPVDHL